MTIPLLILNSTAQDKLVLNILIGVSKILEKYDGQFATSLKADINNFEEEEKKGQFRISESDLKSLTKYQKEVIFDDMMTYRSGVEGRGNTIEFEFEKQQLKLWKIIFFICNQKAETVESKDVIKKLNDFMKWFLGFGIK